jgi:hypothetical protein
MEKITRGQKEAVLAETVVVEFDFFFGVRFGR